MTNNSSQYNKSRYISTNDRTLQELTAKERPITAKSTLKELQLYAYYIDTNSNKMQIGRRQKTTLEELEENIDKYFTKCDTDKKAPTKSGLALHLGYGSIKTMENLITQDTKRLIAELYTAKTKEQKLENICFLISSMLIKRAYLRIEDYLQQCLLTNGKAVGAIFTLKNHYGYKDTQDINQNTNLKGVVVNVNYGAPPKKEGKA